VRCLLIPLVVLAGCSSESSTAKETAKQPEPERKLAGVFPDRFQCDSVLTNEAAGELLGGTANLLVSAISPPRGVPQPCNYQITSESTQEYWTFDIDCRDGMKQRADALFAQYQRTSSELVAHYNAAADAGVFKPTDAGIAHRTPEGSMEVAVGAKGLDHHGQGLIFIDDDAPCYVRVIGPDAARRLELAKVVAKNLTFANAPMSPRPMP
jgi:hypothetical protein